MCGHHFNPTRKIGKDLIRYGMVPTTVGAVLKNPGSIVWCDCWLLADISFFIQMLWQGYLERDILDESSQIIFILFHIVRKNIAMHSEFVAYFLIRNSLCWVGQSKSVVPKPIQTMLREGSKLPIPPTSSICYTFS